MWTATATAWHASRSATPVSRSKDDLICLIAQTFAGETLEGCDAIQTLPGR